MNGEVTNRRLQVVAETATTRKPAMKLVKPPSTGGNHNGAGGFGQVFGAQASLSEPLQAKYQRCIEFHLLRKMRGGVIRFIDVKGKGLHRGGY